MKEKLYDSEAYAARSMRYFVVFWFVYELPFNVLFSILNNEIINADNIIIFDIINYMYIVYWKDF